MTNPNSNPTSNPASNPTSTGIQLRELPATIRGFLDAHAAHDVDAAVKAFRADAVVTDQGQTFRGTEGVLRFLREAGTEFSYTTELVGAARTGDQQWVAVVHIEGDFPGGSAELAYRFTLHDDVVSELHIGA